MEKLMTTQELAEMLNVPLTWIYERTRKKELPTIKLGRYCRFLESDIKALIEDMKGGS